MTTTTIRRLRPAKPVKGKTVSSVESLAFLREFYLEVKREIKKRETIMMNGSRTPDCDSVSFLGENFSLTIDFKEKFRV